MSQPTTQSDPKTRRRSFRRGISFGCPHCGAETRVRDSRGMSRTYREGVLECTSAECGWRGTVSISAFNTLVPSAQPNPNVSVPLSPQAAASMRRALDENEQRRVDVGNTKAGSK